MPARGERRGRTDVEPQRPSESNLTRWTARLGSQCSSPSRAPSQSTRRRKPKVRLGRNVRVRPLFHRHRDSRDRPWSGHRRRLGANSALEDKCCGERQAGERQRELASSARSEQQQHRSGAGYSREAPERVRVSPRSSCGRTVAAGRPARRSLRAALVLDDGARDRADWCRSAAEHDMQLGRSRGLQSRAVLDEKRLASLVEVDERKDKCADLLEPSWSGARARASTTERLRCATGPARGRRWARRTLRWADGESRRERGSGALSLALAAAELLA